MMRGSLSLVPVETDGGRVSGDGSGRPAPVKPLILVLVFVLVCALVRLGQNFIL